MIYLDIGVRLILWLVIFNTHLFLLFSISFLTTYNWDSCNHSPLLNGHLALYIFYGSYFFRMKNPHAIDYETNWFVFTSCYYMSVYTKIPLISNPFWLWCFSILYFVFHCATLHYALYFFYTYNNNNWQSNQPNMTIAALMNTAFILIKIDIL